MDYSEMCFIGNIFATKSGNLLIIPDIHILSFT